MVISGIAAARKAGSKALPSITAEEFDAPTRVD
jgi:hypothetical protein